MSVISPLLNGITVETFYQTSGLYFNLIRFGKILEMLKTGYQTQSVYLISFLILPHL